MVWLVGELGFVATTADRNVAEDGNLGLVSTTILAEVVWLSVVVVSELGVEIITKGHFKASWWGI